MKKVIVTGANGFLGAAICKELLLHDVEIIALVRENTTVINPVLGHRNVRVIHCDLSNYKKIPNLVKDKDIDVVYHLAWNGASGALRSDVNVQISNVIFTCDLVNSCAELSCRRFVFAGSIMEYEVSELMRTDSSPYLNTLYSSAKIASDYMARALAQSLGIDYIRACISNIYGPGEVSPRLVNTSIRKMLNGEHCSFTSGEQFYDFIFITDAAKAFVALGSQGKPNKCYYIGSQKPRPLKDFLLMIRDCVNPRLDIGLGEIPFSGVSLNYNEFDIYALKKDCGFVPKVNFTDGINRTVIWLRENLNEF